jgi:hypothetical protein
MGGIGTIYPAHFFVAMSISFRYLVSAFLVLLLPSGASINAAPPGFVEGHLKIIFGMAAKPSDDMPRQSIPAENYADYPLVILTQEEKKEITRVTADGNGNYRVEVPPGNYILDIQDRVRKHVRARQQSFTVVAGKTVPVDMNIIIGMR